MATLPVETGGPPSALQGLARLAPWRQAILLVAVAAAVAIGVGVALWLERPSYTPLRGKLAAKDIGEVSETLERAGLPFRIAPDGVVLVASEQLQEAEILLADAGLAGSPSLGLDEVLSRDPGIGTSQLMQRSRLHRALEIELARTITAMNPVSSARVHLARPRVSAFVRNHKPPSASVLVELRPGRRLSEAQVDTVRHLVAQAVPDLAPTQVVVTDNSGKLLVAAGDSELVRRQKELDYVRRVEAEKHEKIMRLLTPLVGAEAFTAEVSAEIDFTRTEKASERWNPYDPAVRSVQVTEETSAGPAPAGIPGALSNQPAEPATAPEVAPPGAAASEPRDARRRTRRSELRNNELDKEVAVVAETAPVVTQLSVAVVLDDHRLAGAGDGPSARRPWTPEELSRIEGLVRSAIGFNAERGDVVRVTNAPFAPPVAVAPPPEPRWWELPWLRDAVRHGAVGLLAIVLILGVVRPMMRSLVNREIAERTAEQAREQARLAAATAAENPDAAQLAAQRAAALEGPGPFERNLHSVRSLINGDPRRAANVMKDWVSENG